MALFEKIGEKISVAGKDVAKKTKDLADIAKLNSQISKEEDNIKDVYLQIGKLFYELFPNIDDERFAPFCTSIADSCSKINTYKSQVQAIKGVKKCPKCGSEIDGSSVFCSICGNKMSEIEEARSEVPEKSKCPSCGKPVSEGMAFCTYCGGKLQ